MTTDPLADLTLPEIERHMTAAVTAMIRFYEYDKSQMALKWADVGDESLWEWLGPERAMPLLNMLATLVELRARLEAQR